MTTILAGDIGGTKTTLALFTTDDGPHVPKHEHTFASASFAGLAPIVQEFLAGVNHAHPVERACFGVAGPVVGGQAKITNLPWYLEEADLAEALSMRSVSLINDLVAVASAVPILEVEDRLTLSEGAAEPHGPIAVVAPGTGLGEAYLTSDGVRYVAHPSEGGHSDFAPRNALEVELLQFLLGEFERVSYERVCSGRGIGNIYRFLRDAGHAEEPAWLAQMLAEASDIAPVVGTVAFDEERTCDLCQQTMELFVDILGAEAGNLALKVLATGGVYLGGGIPPRVLPLLQTAAFEQAFECKGRMEHLLRDIPLYLITNPKAALYGAARVALAESEA